MTMSRRAVAGAEPPIERLQPWIAALLSALWHLLFLLLLMSSPEVVVTAPQGAAAGSRMVVDFVGVAPPQPAHASPAPPRPRQPAPRPEPDAAEPAPAESRLQTTRVVRADEPVPEPLPRPSPPAPAPPEVPDAAPQAQAPAASAPPTTQRRAHVWGQPPGMLPQETAPANAGMARSPAVDRGRGRDVSSSGPSLEVGGYQVLYDQRSEARLRAWKDQGMTELFLPLPGTRQYMVCPLETALRRESGPCRLLDPDDPEMAAIGDAREVINMQRVYRRGEVVWRGPGPYR
ncbi:type II toxin-antitoxin system RelE/ParE family toxin [Luteimonas sp. Y-2-2-4F]|nr:type II toxin-antitoxin system RelE/ParE family toxin [Luteimonas sp. Y-2-2-4F]MCD9032185.1 type II toxin-antitoxin system RelE/ParE family toxin [Luteimonas sp. Y-2-2-4F]